MSDFFRANLYIFILAIIFTISGCNESDNTSRINSLNKASEQTQFGELTAYLESYLYVNDMPKGIPPGTPLETLNKDFIAVVKINSIEDIKPDNNISNIYLYILQQDTIIWKSALTDEINESNDKAIEITFRDGPSNLREQTVDIVITFNYLGEEIMIKQKQLYISIAI